MILQFDLLAFLLVWASAIILVKIDRKKWNAELFALMWVASTLGALIAPHL